MNVSSQSHVGVNPLYSSSSYNKVDCHNEGKTDADGDTDPDFLQMKEEEEWKQQTYQPPIQGSSNCTDIDHEANYQNPKKFALGTVSSCNVSSSSSCGLEDMLAANQNKSEHKVCLVTILVVVKVY